MKGTVITNSGIQLLVKLAASGRALEFSRAAVGTGQIPTGYDPQNMINLNAYKMDGTIASCSAAGDTASIVFQLSSEGVTTGFTVTEAGIYAIDPDRGEILYSYLDMTQDPQYVYADGSTITKFIEMTLNVVIGSAANVTTYINPNSLIKREEFETELYKKVDILGGDISDTVITAASVVADEFPDVDSEEKPKTFMAKTKKFFADFKEFKNAIITVSRLANNGQVTEAGFALDARYGKTLYDLYSELYSDLVVGSLGTFLQVKNFKIAWVDGTATYETANFLSVELTLPVTYADTQTYNATASMRTNTGKATLSCSVIKSTRNKVKVYISDSSGGLTTADGILVYVQCMGV